MWYFEKIISDSELYGPLRARPFSFTRHYQPDKIKTAKRGIILRYFGVFALVSLMAWGLALVKKGSISVDVLRESLSLAEVTLDVKDTSLDQVDKKPDLYKKTEADQGDEHVSDLMPEDLELWKIWLENSNSYQRDYLMNVKDRFGRTGTLGKNIVPHWSLQAPVAFTAETLQFNLEEALGANRFNLAWELFQGAENFLSKSSGTRKGIYDVRSGGFISDASLSGQALFRIGGRTADYNTAVDADIGILRGYLELYQKMNSGVFDVSKLAGADGEKVRLALHRHLPVIAEQDVLIHKYKSRSIYTLTVFSNDDTKAYDPSYVDWQALRGFSDFYSAEARKLLSAMSAARQQELGDHPDRAQVADMLLTAVQKCTGENPDLFKKFKQLVQNKDWAEYAQDTLRAEDIYGTVARHDLLSRIILSLPKGERAKARQGLYQLDTLLEYLDHAGFWQKVSADTLQVTKALFCEKIAHRIDQRLKDKAVAGDLEKPLRELQKDLRTPAGPEDIVPVFWSKFVNNKYPDGRVEELLRDAGINELGLTITGISFNGGQFQVVNANNYSGMLEGSEGAREIIRFAEWAARSSDQGLKRFCRLIAGLAQEHTFEVTTEDEQLGRSELEYWKDKFNAKYSDEALLRAKALELFSRMAAAAAGGDTGQIKHYRRTLKDWLGRHPGFLADKNNYFERSLFNISIRLLYDTEKRWPVVYKSAPLAETEFQFGQISPGDYLKKLRNSLSMFRGGDFYSISSDIVRGYYFWGDTQPELDTLNGAGEGEIGGGGDDLNLGLVALVDGQSRQIYKTQFNFAECERNLKTLKGALDQVGIRGPAAIGFFRKLTNAGFEKAYYLTNLWEVILDQTDRGEILKKYEKIVQSRLNGVGAERDIRKALVEPLQKLLLSKNKANNYVHDLSEVWELYENVLNEVLTAGDNIPLRLYLLEALMAGGERFKTEAYAEVIDLFRVYKEKYKDRDEDEFLSANTANYREKLFFRLLKTYYSLSGDENFELPRSKSIGSDQVIFKLLLQKSSHKLGRDKNLAPFLADSGKIGNVPFGAEFEGLARQEAVVDPSLLPQEVRSKYMDTFLVKDGDGLYKFKAGFVELVENSRLSPDAKKEMRGLWQQSQAYKAILEAMPQDFGAERLRYRVYALATELLQKKMERSGDYTLADDVRVLNALTILDLNKAREEQPVLDKARKYLPFFADKDVEDPTSLSEIATTALNRVVWLTSAEANHILEKLPAETLSKDLKDLNEQDYQQLKEIIEKLRYTQGLTKYILDKTENPFWRIVRSYWRLFRGLPVQDRSRAELLNMDKALIDLCLPFTRELTKLKFSHLDFRLLWQFNYTTQNFVLAEVMAAPDRNEQRINLLLEVLENVQKMKLADLKITGQVRPMIMLEQATSLEIILNMYFMEFARELGLEDQARTFLRTSIVQAERATFSEGWHSSPEVVNKRLVPARDKSDKWHNTRKLPAPHPLEMHNNTYDYDLVMHTVMPEVLMFSVEHNIIPQADTYQPKYFEQNGAAKVKDVPAGGARESQQRMGHRAWFSLVLPDNHTLEAVTVEQDISLWNSLKAHFTRQTGLGSMNIRLKLKNADHGSKEISFKYALRRVSGEESTMFWVDDSLKIHDEEDIDEMIMNGEGLKLAKQNIKEHREMTMPYNDKRLDTTRILTSLSKARKVQSFILARTLFRELRPEDKQTTDNLWTYLVRSGKLGQLTALQADLPNWEKAQDLIKGGGEDKESRKIFHQNARILEDILARQLTQDPQVHWQLANVYATLYLLEKDNDAGAAQEYYRKSVKIFENELVKPYLQKAPAEQKVKRLEEVKGFIDYASVLTKAPSAGKNDILLAKNYLDNAGLYFLRRASSTGYIGGPNTVAQLIRWINAYGEWALVSGEKEQVRIALRLVDMVMGKDLEPYPYKDMTVPQEIRHLLEENTENRGMLGGYKARKDSYLSADKLEKLWEALDKKMRGL